MGINTETSIPSCKIRFGSAAFLKEMLLTLIAAVLTGLSGGLLLIMLVFGWGHVQAEPLEKLGAHLDLRSLDGQLIEQAPLLNTEVEIEISGMLAWVKVEQVFTNPSQYWMEGRYQFPLPDGCAVERLNMQIGERLIAGRIEEKKQAKRLFQQAKSEGKRASLLSQQRPNIFSLAATNIAPGERVRIAIEYQQQIHYSKQRFEMRFPMVVGPRYMPNPAPLGADREGDADSQLIASPVIAQQAGLINPLSMHIRLDAGVPLDEVVSHYHPMRERRDQQGIVDLRLVDGEIASDRDFVLSWKPRVGAEPEAALFREHWQDKDYALLMLMPPDGEIESATLPRELIFIIDHSGSMNGTSMSQAKAALRLAVEHLSSTDRFNLIAFNDHSDMLFSAPQTATQTNIGRAADFINRLQANGGTEMLPALELALNQSKEEGYLRQVVFLTDGSVANEQALFHLIQQKLGQNRLFTIGIGSAPNSYFMQRAAEFGRGSFSYIGDQSEVSASMQALFEKLEHPSMSHIRLEWRGSGELDVEPERLPDLYLGEPLLLAIKGDALDGELVVSGEREGSPWVQHIEMGKKQPQRQGIHALWARQRIKSLMAAPKTVTHEAKRQAVLDLAMTHQLVSPYTSLVAVDAEPVRPPEAALGGGDVPLSLPQGWSSQGVFGHLPQTASGAPFYLLVGVMLLLLAWVIQSKFRVSA
ncbi:MAG: marine proteobacterial sortase target protein [Candidatus Thiodiazotropha sp.]